MFIPATHPSEFIGAGTAKQGGKHQAKDFAQELLLGSEAPVNLQHQVVREPQVMERLMQGVDGALSLVLLVLVAGLGIQTLVTVGFGLFFDVSFA
jgi:hypothetical protein